MNNDVFFLSFRGAHARYGFTGHGYEVLCNLCGECSQGWCTESKFEFIQRIFKEISSIKLNCTKLFVAKYLVGIDSRVEAIDMKSNDVLMVAIHGMGGVGKNTITKAVYNRIADHFEGSCFLENIKEKSRTNDGLIQLQETLLSKIFGDRYFKVNSVPEGINRIIERLFCTRVLLILDDVDKSRNRKFVWRM